MTEAPFVGYWGANYVTEPPFGGYWGANYVSEAPFEAYWGANRVSLGSPAPRMLAPGLCQ